MAGRTIIAKHIIATAKAGNLNRQSLADGALLYLAKQKLHRKSLHPVIPIVPRPGASTKSELKLELQPRHVRFTP
jgi:hypothetical protein